MCGIIGYTGARVCKPLLLGGLERLEYRGYDSAGLSLVDGDERRDRARRRQPERSCKRVAGTERLARHDRHRPHALGDPRPPVRAQRAPARRAATTASRSC